MSLIMPVNNLVDLMDYFSVPWKMVARDEFNDFWSSLTVREKHYFLTTPIPRPITHQ